jgi:hypothetical protein
MKAKILGLIGALLLVSPFAKAATFEGSWKNTTFGSTGGMKITFSISGLTVNGSIDFDGPVFGGTNPAPLVFTAAIGMAGATFNVIDDSVFGDVDGTVLIDGTTTITMTNLPPPANSFTSIVMSGKFDFARQKFTATYVINDAGGVFAQGTGEAHVKGPAKPTVPKAKITFKGTSSRATFRVDSVSAITSVKASAKPTANVKVIGGNPYTVLLKKPTGKVTTVKVNVINADGFKTVVTLKFIAKPKK